jgi:hypothetical protein
VGTDMSRRENWRGVEVFDYYFSLRDMTVGIRDGLDLEGLTGSLYFDHLLNFSFIFGVGSVFLIIAFPYC